MITANVVIKWVKSPEMGEDLAEVVAAAAQDGEDRVAGRALQRAA